MDRSYLMQSVEQIHLNFIQSYKYLLNKQIS